MSRELDKVRESMMAQARQELDQLPVPFDNRNSFFSFRYSCTEISSRGGKLNVKMRETRFQDGKLTQEECEGTVDRNTVDAMISEAQNQFLTQVGNVMRLFFLPFGGGR